MASSQQVSNVAQLNDNEKAKIAEAVKEAKSFHANQPNAKVSQHELALIVGAARNDEHREIGLLKSHTYKGEFVADPPKTIAGNGGTGAFVVQGAPRDENLPVVVGPKGAVIYGNIDEPNKLYKYGWLLAYHKPADSNAPNKVYVEAGFKERLLKLEWSEIEHKLDASGHRSHYWDHESGAAAVAEIQNQGNNLSFLGANFHLRPRN